MHGSYRTPTLEHAAVGDVMHPGLLTCGPDTDLQTVAQIMVTHHIHSVLVSGIESTGGGEKLAWGLISDLDLVAASQRPELMALDAGQLASTEVVTVDADEPLERAAALMAEHQLAHLLVTAGGRPTGMLSTLDIAGAVAWGEA